MAPFSHFAVIAAALSVIAACSVAMTLRTFGFWRWAKYQWADMKAWLFDAETDDEPVVYHDEVFAKPPRPRKRKKG
jgi:hypothetical protein